MSQSTKIEWTETTWNPVTGCTPISMGCHRCYARVMAIRLQAIGHPNYTNGFAVSLHAHELQKPMLWGEPTMVFVCSMADLFHDDVPDSFIAQVFDSMCACPQHTFQVLTKRAERLAQLAPKLPWPKNVWVGVTVEHADYLGRIDLLLQVPAAVRFLSLEPLLSPLPNLDLTEIGWVIVGGESGPGSKPVPRDWVTDIRDQCVTAGVPFFFKQWGGQKKKANGRLLDDRTWDEMPISHTRRVP